jgi:methylated-DNA-[protein]-cysteine S-methyltransferase
MADLEARLRAGSDVSGPAGDAALRPPVLPDTDVAYDLVDTPVGRLVVAASERGLVATSYETEEVVLAKVARLVSPRVLRGGRRLDPARRELDDYFAGRRQGFTVPVDLALTGDFGRAVLGALDAVPFGATTTYGELAQRIGRPGASRAVGRALGANPVCVVVPCHRVLRSDGGLSGYAGGLPAKEALLLLEATATSEAPDQVPRRR